jgi:hypothetical protein
VACRTAEGQSRADTIGYFPSLWGNICEKEETLWGSRKVTVNSGVHSRTPPESYEVLVVFVLCFPLVAVKENDHSPAGLHLHTLRIISNCAWPIYESPHLSSKNLESIVSRKLHQPSYLRILHENSLTIPS